MKYEAKITSIGESVLTFMKVRNSLILFNNDVPYAYENMVVSHTKGTLTQPIEAGDTLVIAEEAYRVNDVGAEANQTLRTRPLHPHIRNRTESRNARPNRLGRRKSTPHYGR